MLSRVYYVKSEYEVEDDYQDWLEPNLPLLEKRMV